MRKANATIYAAAALGLCFMIPQGAAASPATPDMGKAYTQAAKGGNLTLARFGRGGAVAVGRVGRFGGMRHFGGVGRFGAVGVRHYGLGRGLGYGYGRRAYWGGRGLRGGYYGLGRGFGYGHARRAYWGGRGLRGWLLWRMGSRIRSWPGAGVGLLASGSG